MKKKTTPAPKSPETVFHNNTPFSLEEIRSFKVIGTTINGWRQRNVALIQHPTEPDKVISRGTTFDRRMCVISVEDKSQWATALDYIAHGKVYRSE